MSATKLKPKNATPLPSLSTDNGKGESEVSPEERAAARERLGPEYEKISRSVDEVFGRAVVIDVPLAEYPPHAYAARHIEVRLSEDQAHTLKRIFCALEKQGATLAGGQPIRRAPDVFRYLLEAIADA